MFQSSLGGSLSEEEESQNNTSVQIEELLQTLAALLNFNSLNEVLSEAGFVVAVALLTCRDKHFFVQTNCCVVVSSKAYSMSNSPN